MTMIPIASQVVGAGGAASVTFSNIPQTFTHLHLRCFASTNRATYGSDNFFLRFNGDTGSNFVRHLLNGNGSSAVSGYTAATSKFDIGLTGASTASNIFSNSLIDILDYANTNKNKVARALTGIDHNGTIAGFGGEVMLASGLWLSISAITNITLGPTAGTLFLQNTRFDLYGIQTASATGV